MISRILSFLLILFLPTQLGKHFFLPFSYINGLRIDYLAPAVYFTDIIVLLLILCNLSLLKKMLSKKWVLGVLLVLITHSLLVPQVKEIALYQAAKIFEVIILFFFFRTKPLSHKLLLTALVIGASFEAGLVIAQFLLKSSVQGFFYFFGERYVTLSMPDIAKVTLQGVEILRPYGTFSHPNSLGGFYLLLYVFVLTLKKSKAVYTLSSLFILLSSFLVFFSFSKLAILGYILVTIAYLILKQDFSCKLCLTSRLLVLGVLGYVFSQAQGDPLSFAKRGELMGESMQMLARQGLVGVGLGNYLVAQSKLVQSPLFLFPQPVHNILLLFINEVGLVLGAIVLFFLGREFYRKRTSVQVMLVLAAVILLGSFDHYMLTLQQNVLLLPVVFGLAKLGKGL